MFEDACRIMTTESSLRSRSNIVGHLCREIESALHDLVPAPASGSGLPEVTCEACGKITRPPHREKVVAAMNALAIAVQSDEGAAWLYLVGKLHRLAHRNGLDPTRPLDDEFDKTWQAFNKALSGVLGRVESNYAKFHEQIDDMFR